MDSTLLRGLLGELEPELLGATVDGGGGLTPLAIFLIFRRRKRRRTLLLSAEPGLARLEAPPEFVPPKHPLPQGAPIAARLKGARIAGLETFPWERYVRLHFERRGDFGPPENLTLAARLMPARPALALLDERGDILALLAPGRGREVAPGVTELPPRPSLPTPEELTPGWAESMLGKPPVASVAERIRRQVFGLTPALAREIAHRAGLARVLTPPLPPASTMKNLEAELEAVVRDVTAGGEAFVYLPGCPYIALTRLSHLTSSHEENRFDSVAAALSLYWREFLLGREVRRLRQEIEALLRRARRRAEALARGLGGELADAEVGEESRRRGEALVAHLGLARAGAREVRVPDVHDPGGGEVVVPLDPSLSPQENVRRYFRRARKAERARREIPPRLERVRGVVASITRSEERLAAIDSREELQELREQIVDDLAAWVLRREERVERELGKRPGGRRLRTLGINPRRFVLAPGWTILVGRNNRENDILTTRVAAPQDLWFHARAVGGSHVLLLRPGRKTQPTAQLIERAAQAAAFFSRGRTSGIVPVAYTEARYVRKPRGAPPGLVVMTREKVLMVTPRKPEAAVTPPPAGGDAPAS